MAGPCTFFLCESTYFSLARDIVVHVQAQAHTGQLSALLCIVAVSAEKGPCPRKRPFITGVMLFVHVRVLAAHRHHHRRVSCC